LLPSLRLEWHEEIGLPEQEILVIAERQAPQLGIFG
jgi:hypothetical protein